MSRKVRSMTNKPAQYQCRASAYMLVLGVSTMVTVIGLSALMVARINTRMVTQGNDSSRAWFLAMSATEHALTVLDTDKATWRSTYTSGATAQKHDFGSGSFRWVLVDEADGDLKNTDTDPVRLYGIGEIGQVRRVNSVLLQPGGSTLTCLEVAFCTAGDLNLDDATANCNQIISSNCSVTGVGSSQIDGDVEAGGTITGISGSGTRTPGITPLRTMPDPNTVYDYYIDIANGTPIDINTIPSFKSKYTMSGVVLSPTWNPFGAGVTNPKGIYVIDAQGYELEIEYSRIVGTLVILNGSPTCSYVQGAVNWEPAIPNYPALLVQGPLCLYMDGTAPLDETDAGTSLNPMGAPYDGFWDGDTDDTYPSIIKGLIYAESRLDVASFPVVNGVVVSGGIVNVTPSTVFDLTFDKTYLDNPPPGFRNPRISVSDGSWRRGTN